jgi:hypothetical protein
MIERLTLFLWRMMICGRCISVEDLSRGMTLLDLALLLLPPTFPSSIVLLICRMPCLRLGLIYPPPMRQRGIVTLMRCCIAFEVHWYLVSMLA